MNKLELIYEMAHLYFHGELHEMITQIGKTAPNLPFLDAESSLIAELQELDLTSNEARILVFLLTRGHSNASEISRQTGIQRTETYNYISRLLSKGIVFSTFDRPQKYYSAPIEEVIDMLTESKRKALEGFESRKEEYRRMLDSIVGNKVVRTGNDGRERYNVIVGENAVLARIERMLGEAKEEVLAMVTDRDLANFYHEGRADQLVQLANKGISVELRTASKNVDEYILQGDNESSILLPKTMENMVPTTFVIVDGKEMIILLETNPFKKSELCGFYTNNQSLITVFKFMFKKI